MIRKSILDYSWFKQTLELSITHHAPVFFIAQGVMIYFAISEIHELLKNICQAFPQAEVFFDIFNERAKKIAGRRLMFKDENVKIKSALNSGKLIEEWGIGFKVLSEWYYSDDPDAKRGWMKFIWVIPAVRKLQYCMHGKFEKIGLE